MDNFNVKTAVAFFVFNRPDVTQPVFERIRTARPPVLLLVADGPRPANPEDIECCMAVRDIVNKVDWPCTVYRDFAENNLGCRKRVSSGLDWVFSLVSEAIILEDDCLPNPTFFRFCEELLEKYRDDERIMMVSGFNPRASSNSEGSSYFFSKYPHIWGWASWRRAWTHYDVDLTLWPEVRDSNKYRNFSDSTNEARFWRNCFDDVHGGIIDTWDAQVSFMFFCHTGLAVFPDVNLISNIGFGEKATHTKIDNGTAGMQTGEFVFPVQHPATIERDRDNDNERVQREYSYKGTVHKLLQLAARIFPGIRHERNI